MIIKSEKCANPYKIQGIQILLMVCIFLLPAAVNAEISSQAVKNLKLSKETTLITKPLLPNGLPDYNTYLNNKYKVLPEKNAAALLYSLIGHTGKDTFSSKEQAELKSFTGFTSHRNDQQICLGMNDLWEFPAFQHWISVYADMIRQGGKADPQRLKELLLDPDVSAWMRKHTACLEAFTEIVNYKSLYYPYIYEGWKAEAPDPDRISYIRDGLLIKSWAAVANQEYIAAMDQFIDMLKIGRLFAQQPGIPVWWNAYAFSKNGYTGLKYLVDRCALRQKQIEQLKQVLIKHPPVSIAHGMETYTISSLRLALKKMPHDIENPNPPLRFIIRNYDKLHRGFNSNSGDSLKNLIDDLKKMRDSRNRLEKREAPAPISLGWLCDSAGPDNRQQYVNALLQYGFKPGEISCKNRANLVFSLQNHGNFIAIWESVIEEQINLKRLHTELMRSAMKTGELSTGMVPAKGTSIKKE